MRSLSAQEVVGIWEQTAGGGGVARALAPLAAVCQEHSREELARLPLGRRDALLLDLYRATFGPGFELHSRCPQCHERLDVDLSVNDLQAARNESGLGDGSGEFRLGELILRFRAPDSNDMEIIALVAKPEEARQVLVKRCVLAAQRAAEEITVGHLTDEELAAFSEALSEADPQAEILLELDCPVCHFAWQALLDVVECFWHRLSVASRNLLREVHTLASAYGWREEDILALSPWRRRTYLEMVEA